MKFTATRRCKDSQNFADALFDDIIKQLDSLPLERFCMRGGWPLDVRISTVSILENKPDKLVVVLYVSFTESGAACCSGDNFEHEHFEELSMTIDKSDWSCEFPVLV